MVWRRTNRIAGCVKHREMRDVRLGDILGNSTATTTTRYEQLLITPHYGCSNSRSGPNPLRIPLNDREIREFSVANLCRYHTVFLNFLVQNTQTPTTEQHPGVSVSYGYASPQIFWSSFAHLSFYSCCEAKGLHILPHA